MNYIYDILLNFNNVLYDIFEWNKNDDITHVRKIPFFKVDKETMFNFISKKVELKDDFLLKIFNKTEVFNKNRIDTICYSFLISDGIDVIALKLCGSNIKYSRLLIDEEREVIEYVNSMPTTSINYGVIKKYKKAEFKTRNEMRIKKYINKRINELIHCNDYDKLRYLYLDCFNCNVDDVEKEFIVSLNKNWDNVYLKLYNLLKLIETR